MGKASRAKRDRRQQQPIDHLARLKAGLCMHCGLNPRNGRSDWCRACAAKGRRIAEAAGLAQWRSGGPPRDPAAEAAMLEWLEAHPEP